MVLTRGQTPSESVACMLERDGGTWITDTTKPRRTNGFVLHHDAFRGRL